MRALRIAALVATAAAIAGFSVPIASAEPTQAVSIESTVTDFADFQGVWHSSGAFTDSGTFVEPFVEVSGSYIHSPVVAAFRAELVFTGTRGTITVRQQLTFTAEAFNGVWEVISGTGAYEGASGHGTFEFTVPDNLDFMGVMNLTRAG